MSLRGGCNQLIPGKIRDSSLISTRLSRNLTLYLISF